MTASEVRCRGPWRTERVQRAVRANVLDSSFLLVVDVHAGQFDLHRFPSLTCRHQHRVPVSLSVANDDRTSEE